LYVFGKRKIDVPHLVQTVCREFSPETKLLIFYDVGYYHAIPELEKSVLDARGSNTVFARVEKEAKRQFHLAGRIVNCTSGECVTCDDESIECRDGNCCESSSSSSEQIPQTTNPSIPVTSSIDSSTSTTNTAGQSSTNTTDQSTNTTNQATNITEQSTPDTTTQSTNTSTTINGRSFELLPETSLQDYTFLCIFLVLLYILFESG
jgi:hypothetical protein